MHGQLSRRAVAGAPERGGEIMVCADGFRDLPAIGVVDVAIRLAAQGFEFGEDLFQFSAPVEYYFLNAKDAKYIQVTVSFPRKRESRACGHQTPAFAGVTIKKDFASLRFFNPPPEVFPSRRRKP